MNEKNENTTSDRALKCVAWLMHELRPEWEFNGCLTVVRRAATGRSLSQLARAALWFAEHRTSQRTPAMLAEDGAHWHLDDERGPLPAKPRCLTEPPRDPVPPERIREIRQQARQGDR